MKRLAVRLMVSHVITAFLVLVVAGLVAGRLVDRYLVSLDEATGQTRLDEAARVSAVILAEFPEADRDRIQAILSRALVGVRVTAQTQSDISSVLIARGQPLSLTSSKTGSQMIRAIPAPDAERARVITVEENAEIRSAYRIALESPTTIRTGALHWSLIGAGSIGLMTAILLALGFNRPIIEPLNRMAVAAERLSDGDWDTPLLADGPVEIKRLAGSFRAMAEKLHAEFQRLRADRRNLQQLIGEMAHELKTPITSLRTYHELLLGGELENPETRWELLQRGASQVHRLEYLTQTLLEMARLEADSQALDLVEADLVTLVHSAVASMSPIANRRGIHLDVAAPSHAVMALVDLHRFGQAVDNLLQNALHFSPAGGVVRVSVELTNGMAVLSISDAGPGIPEELLPRIFQPFVRGPASQGAGLGLAVVRTIAEAHAGSVTAENLPTGGAQFVLTLPALD